MVTNSLGSRVTRYASRNEAILREILEPMRAGVQNPEEAFDIEALANEVLEWQDGYCLALDYSDPFEGESDFWSIAEKHARY